MTWEEWVKEYPPVEVDVEPPPGLRIEQKPMDDYIDAEKYRDWCEEYHEIACRVVKFNGKFYVIHAI